jgi:hypothetical protein
MSLSPAERRCLKNLVLGQHRDWAGLHTALEAKKLTISQSSLDRFFSGKTSSLRTLRTLAKSLGTTPEALENQVRLLARDSRTHSPTDFASVKPLRDPGAFQVAFQLWIEMTTRKLALPIDPAHDVIVECYDSWYAFFKAARELIKTIPLHKNPRSDEMRRLVHLSQAVLNDGIRPHLQRWQARFRRWCGSNSGTAAHGIASPQETQQQFPEWKLLRDDLLATNQRLIAYVAALEVMVARPNTPIPRLRPARKG